MFSRQLILLFLTLVLAACESLVTDIDQSKLPQVDSKLVVQCFISPQSTRTNVVVTESIPLFAEPDYLKGGVIRNAIVKLSDGAKEVVVPFDTASQLYSIDKSLFTISAGKTYSLSVTDGVRSVKATCTVPANEIRAATYEIDSSYSGPITNRDTSLTVKMTWYDIAQETNYYRVRASIDLEYSVPDGTTPENFKEKRIRNRFNFNWDDTIGRNDFRNDVNLDGASFNSPIGRVNLPVGTSYDFGNGNSFYIYPKSKIVSVTMEIYNADEHYFKYHRSLQTRGDSDNPFIEPSLIYTNIDGGLGCFASYNSGQVIYRPK
ncbi:DUF4249 domain-containing protein [Dyadobacter sp. CY261]|uniref:DUF4249 domain-containing protein n=1 Tax=Dyadobacter sp. CY261 TaxID=2907203 RepID=UPI001F27C1E3|nr:DUF4249 domain-containing protein [Dyadobacter sp. CY261]MCF0074648.1 DUF4249 domain-containing protein [Dyadobacter sp. CY261]